MTRQPDRAGTTAAIAQVGLANLLFCRYSNIFLVEEEGEEEEGEDDDDDDEAYWSLGRIASTAGAFVALICDMAFDFLPTAIASAATN